VNINVHQYLSQGVVMGVGDRFNRRLLAGAAVCALTPAMAWSVSAAAAPAATAASAQGSPEVGEVVVTARKVRENILKTPLAVTALSSQELSKRGITGYQGLEDFTPGFRMENSTVSRNDRGLYTFVIRGMYPADDESDRQSVSIFLDGTPIAGGAVAGLTDVDQIEVVNGPQSAYFGRSTFAGAVNFITKTPSSKPTATIDASFGQWQSVDVKASVEGPLIPDILSARASFREYNYGGQYPDYGYGGRLGQRSTQSGALDLNFTPTNNFHANAYVTVWRDRDGPAAQGILTNANCNAGGTISYFCGGYSSVPAYTITQNPYTQAMHNQVSANDPIYTSGRFNQNGLDRQAVQSVLTGEYDLPDGFVLSANAGLGFNNFQLNFDPVNQFPSLKTTLAYVPQKEYSDSAEIRLTSPQTGRLKYLVGFNYATDGLSYDTSVDVGPIAIVVSPPVSIVSHTYGIFGSASYDFTNKLTLDAELREQIDQISEQVLLTPYHDAATYDSFSPRVILRYQIDPNMQAYASYSTGTRPGQFNISLLGLTPAEQLQITSQGNVPARLPQESISMGELGLKGLFFNRTLRIMADVYYGDWKNINVSRNVEYLNGGTPSTIVLTEAGGAAQLYGVEFQGSYTPTRNWTFDGTFDYSGTRITQTNCIECLAITGNADPLGNSLPRYPITSGSLSATYRRPVGGGFDGYVRGDYIYTGRQYDTDANTAWIPASNRFNARIGVQNDHYTFEIYGTNLFNDKTPLSINQGTNYVTGGYALVLVPAELQSFGVRIVAKY
jgi:iron complex outermembrane receptor protein